MVVGDVVAGLRTAGTSLPGAVRPKPFVEIVLSMSVDGHIADAQRSPARIGSAADREHLDRRLAEADAVLLGATTIRAVGHAVLVLDPQSRVSRRRAGRPEQPVQVVASRTCRFDQASSFFSEPVTRWLVTTRDEGRPPAAGRGFDDVLATGLRNGGVDWIDALTSLRERGIERLCVLGGGELVSGILAADLVDALWLTVCPVLVGGVGAPTPVDGPDLPLGALPPVTLLSARRVDQEVFLQYSLR